MSTYLELERHVVDITTIFIVVACVLPDEAHGVCQRVPALEQSVARGLFAADDSLDLLLHGCQRHGILDERIVVLQLSRWQVEEGRKYGQVAPVCLLARRLLHLRS